MKRVFIIISLIILLGLIYLAVVNYNNSADLNLVYSVLLHAQNQAGWTEQGPYMAKTINLAVLIISILLAGIFVGAGIVYMFLDATKDKVKAYQRELEKTSISGSNNASKVEVLEAKIKTLEKAFNTVIDERKQLEVQIENLNIELDKINKDK